MSRRSADREAVEIKIGGVMPPVGRDGASLEELRREWHRLHHSEPPRISRDLLIRAIEAYPADSGSSICSWRGAPVRPTLFRGLSRLMMSQ